jgi:hypothetical protein
LRLTEATAPLDYFDLVTVGVGDEEKARQRPAVMLEVAQWPRRQFFSLEPDMFGIDVVDDHSEMAVSVTERIGLFAVEIDGQFDLERRRWMTQVDQREIRKFEMIGNFKSERAGVEPVSPFSSAP